MIKRLSTLLKASLIGTSIIFMAISAHPFSTAHANELNQIEGIKSSETKVIERPVDFREAAKKAIPAVVSIKVKSKKGSSIFGGDEGTDLFEHDFWRFFGLPRKDSRSQPLFGQASGVLVSSDGYILTNSHVVKDMDNISIQLHDGREYLAKVLGEDTNIDLAVLKIEGQDLPYLKLANSDQLEVGQWVAAIGNPFGLQATFTVGIVSAKGRNNLDIIRYEDFIQTDAPINRGNSGGALVNLDGDVVGINTAIATNGSSGYMGIGFAIPSNMAQYVMKEIISGGKVTRGFLGISLQTIDYNLAQSFDLKKVEGALVTSVEKGSPAERAGIRSEDIILKYDNHPVENAATLRNGVYMMRPETKTVLTVLRQGQTLEIPVEVGRFIHEQEPATSSASKHALGLEVDDLNPEISQTLGYTNDKGVLITKVQTDSPAALIGIKKGALILAVNRHKIENKNQFYTAISNTPSGKPVLLHVKQGDRYFFVSIQVD